MGKRCEPRGLQPTALDEDYNLTSAKLFSVTSSSSSFNPDSEVKMSEEQSD
jgi:hypothetical protein